MHAVWFLVVAAFFVTPTSSTESGGELIACLFSLTLFFLFVGSNRNKNIIMITIFISI